MRLLTVVPFLSALATAAPSGDLARRQGATSTEIADGQCKAVSFVMARGSTEPGNMGTIVGGPLCAALKQAMNGDVACQGVGGAYTAQLAPNLLPKGTSDDAIQEGVNTLNMAATKCPNAPIVFAGYSQGSAVMLGAVQAAPAATKQKLAAGMFYGYTMNAKQNGMLPGFPQQNLKVFCRQDDGVCGNQLSVTAGHLAYANDGSIGQGAQFATQRLQAQGVTNKTN